MSEEKMQLFAGKQILVVDDYDLTRELIKEILTELGCHVDITDTGPKALKCAQTKPYDLILLDILLPEMDGLEVSRQLRTHGNQVPIIALSATATQTIRKECQEAGINEYIKKPIQPEKIILLIQKYLQPTHNNA